MIAYCTHRISHVRNHVFTPYRCTTTSNELASNAHACVQIKGSWNVIEYYASSEEVEIYRCMRSTFNLSPDVPEISMDFTYSYADDPDNEMLTGNITWNIPSFEMPGHWVHEETPCKALYLKNIKT